MRCELCDSEDKLSFHHLVPKKMHGRTYIEKNFPDTDLNSYGTMLCSPCHKMLHRKIDHRTLALDYNTLEKLKEHPGLKIFIAFRKKSNKQKRVK
jgi:hypothetical protein